ncbi:DUF6906 family protein [Clostridium botulinum]|uniref:DUF6906 family protein n=1 Tax=Clostridium botulinum TaxID=1491 RepID=UPI000B23747E|nr:hypothetical protein [Clostridium botulinum]
MKHLKRLSRNQKKALSSLGLEPKHYLRLTQDGQYFVPVDIRTNKILPPVRY